MTKRPQQPDDDDRADKPADGDDRADKPGDDDREEEELLRCRKCGCPHLPVYYTTHQGPRIRRVRFCRNCGERKITFEREAGKS